MILISIEHGICCTKRRFIAHKPSARRFSSLLISSKPHLLEPEQRQAILELGNALSYTNISDWYRLKVTDVQKSHKAAQLLPVFDWSPSLIVASVFPHHKWLPWKFYKRPRGLWDTPTMRRAFFDWAQQELNITSLDGFYTVSFSQISRLGGYTLLKTHYKKTVSQAVMDVYPEYEWRPWRFKVTPQLWWQNKQKLRLFFDDYAAAHGIASPTDWPKIQLKDIIHNGGSFAFFQSHYGSSLRSALQDVYPEHDWSVLETRQDTPPKAYPSWRVPSGYWLSATNRRAFFENLATKEGFKSKEDWYSMNTQMIHQQGGGGLLARYYRNSFVVALVDLFPEHQWDRTKFFRKAKVEPFDLDTTTPKAST